MSDPQVDLARNETDPLGCYVPYALVIEDDEDLLELLGIHLRRLGCEVHLCSNGAAAFSSIAERVPDLAVIDVGLPDADGRVIAQGLLHNKTTADCRVI